jgi:DNA-binding MurR/RpiR family transcriptional regulator
LVSRKTMHSEEIKKVKASKLTFAHVSKTFHLPIQQAAKELGMSKSALQKRCRKIGVKQWPYRKIAAVMRSKPNYTKEDIDKILIYLRKCPDSLNSFISMTHKVCL